MGVPAGKKQVFLRKRVSDLDRLILKKEEIHRFDFRVRKKGLDSRTNSKQRICRCLHVVSDNINFSFSFSRRYQLQSHKLLGANQQRYL